MKIAVITPVYSPITAGIGTVAQSFANALYQFGHQVKVFTPKEKERKKDRFVSELSPIARFGYASITPELRNLKGFDLIHLHYPFIGGVEWVISASYKEKIPLLVTYHMDLVGTSWKRLVFGLWTRYILSRLIKQAKKITVSSFDYLKSSLLKEYYEREPFKFIELPFGVDTKLFCPASKAEGLRTQFVAIFVGGLDKAHYFKGLSFLLRAIKKAKNWQLKVVGEGPLKFRYQQEAEELGITDRTQFLGRLSEEEIVANYSEADLLVLPSIDKSEAFGMVILEAAACGTPALVSNLPGPRSLVKHGQTGIIIESGNVEEIVRSLRELEDPCLLKEMGRRARELVIKNFDSNKIALRLNYLIQSLRETGKFPSPGDGR